MSQLVATADFDVWSPDHSRVSTAPAEAKGVSKERTELLLRVDLLPLSMYLQLIAYFSFLVYWSKISTGAPFPIRVPQKRERIYSLTSKRPETEKPDMSFSIEWAGLSILLEMKWIS